MQSFSPGTCPDSCNRSRSLKSTSLQELGDVPVTVQEVKFRQRCAPMDCHIGLLRHLLKCIK